MNVQPNVDEDFVHDHENVSAVMAIAKEVAPLNLRNVKTNNAPTLWKSLIGLLGSSPMNLQWEVRGTSKDFDFRTSPPFPLITKLDKCTRRRDFVGESTVAPPQRCKDLNPRLMFGAIGPNVQESVEEVTRSRLGLVPTA